MQKEYKVSQGENLLSVATLLYGSPSYVLKLAIDNNLNISDDISGLTLIYDESIKSVPAQIKTVKILPVTDTINYNVIEGQSIYDVCIQETGSLQSIVSLIIENSLTLKTDVLGVKFNYSKKQIINTSIHNFNKKNGQLYGTKFTGSVTENLPVYCSFNRSFSSAFNGCYRVHLSFDNSFDYKSFK